MRKWMPIVILACAQFVMVLDSSVMNVSISQIVADLDTSIEGVQAAITMYTLVMAAFMLAGAKLGDIVGRDRIFVIGLAVYGLGSLTTSLSPNLPVLLIGWSLIEGLGAALVIPAIAALIAANYEGKDRALCFGILGGVAGAAIALGPLIGGWVTTELSWRYVFAAETVIVIAIILARGQLHPAGRMAKPPKLDVIGVALSAAGLGLAVFGVLKSSQWGWIEPLAAPTIGGTEITPLGFSVVPFLILGGLSLLAGFATWEERRERLGRDVLLDRSLLRIVTLRAGLSTLMMQQLILLGTFFVLPVYLQVVLGLDAFETGKRLFPMSLAILVAALFGPRLAAVLAPKRVAQLGLVSLVIAAAVLLGTIDVTLDTTTFALALALFGIGAGLLLSQLGNVIMSSVGPDQTNEAGGLQGTAQNLGASLGTAIIGSVLIAALTSGFVAKVEQNPDLPQKVRDRLVDATASGIPIVPVDQVEQVMLDNGLPKDQAESVADDYGDAQLDGLQRAIGAVAIISFLSLWFTRRLPAAPVRAGPDEPVAAAA